MSDDSNIKAKELYFIDNRHDGGGKHICLYDQDGDIGELNGPYVAADGDALDNDEGIEMALRLTKSYNALRLLTLEQIDDLTDELSERYGEKLSHVRL